MKNVIATAFSVLPTTDHLWKVHKAIGWSADYVASIANSAGTLPEFDLEEIIRHDNAGDRVNAERTLYYGNVISRPLSEMAVRHASEDGFVLCLHENILPGGAGLLLFDVLKKYPNLAWVSIAPRLAPDGSVLDNSSRCVAWRAASLLRWTEAFTIEELDGKTTMDAIMTRMNLAGESANYRWLNELQLPG